MKTQETKAEELLNRKNFNRKAFAGAVLGMAGVAAVVVGVEAAGGQLLEANSTDIILDIGTVLVGGITGEKIAANAEKARQRRAARQNFIDENCR